MKHIQITSEEYKNSVSLDENGRFKTVKEWRRYMFIKKLELLDYMLKQIPFKIQ